MARLPVAGENAAIAAILVPGTTYYLSVNTGDPGTTGASEMTSVTRAAIVFTSASAGAETNTAAVTVTTPGTSAATYVSVWSASTGGTFIIGAAMGSSVTATSIAFAIGAVSFSAS